MIVFKRFHRFSIFYLIKMFGYCCHFVIGIKNQNDHIKRLSLCTKTFFYLGTVLISRHRHRSVIKFEIFKKTLIYNSFQKAWPLLKYLKNFIIHKMVWLFGTVGRREWFTRDFLTRPRVIFDDPTVISLKIRSI